MRLKAPASAAATYLRVADRRTLDLLGVVIGRARLVAGLGELGRWYWIDSRGGLSSIEARLDAETNAEALRLSPLEWAEFAMADRVHPCLARWLGELELCQQSLPEVAPALEQALRAVRTAQDAARRWPQILSHVDDLIAWAAMSLLHPGFEQSDACLRWLNASSGAVDSAREPFNTHCHTLRARLATQAEPLT